MYSIQIKGIFMKTKLIQTAKLQYKIVLKYIKPYNTYLQTKLAKVIFQTIVIYTIYSQI